MDCGEPTKTRLVTLKESDEDEDMSDGNQLSTELLVAVSQETVPGHMTVAKCLLHPTEVLWDKASISAHLSAMKCDTIKCTICSFCIQHYSGTSSENKFDPTFWANLSVPVIGELLHGFIVISQIDDCQDVHDMEDESKRPRSQPGGKTSVKSISD